MIEHIMGNYIVIYGSSKPRTGKVFLSDGTVHEFQQPTTVAELMLDHPQQVVVEFQSNGGALKQRATPLPADHSLDMKKVYVMLPMMRGGGGGAYSYTYSNNAYSSSAMLSSEVARRRVLLTASMGLNSGCFLRSLRVFSVSEKISPASDIVVAGHNGTGLAERHEETAVKVDLFSEMTAEERPEFLSRQFSAKGWKPNLDPIKEKKIERKVSRWLF